MAPICHTAVKLFWCALRQKENRLENQQARTLLTNVFLKSCITKDVSSVSFLLRQETLCVTAQSQVAMETKKKKARIYSFCLFFVGNLRA